MSTITRTKHTPQLDTASSSNSRARILDAAVALITRRGEASVTIAEIAKAARLSRQGVYLHFADRAELLIALVQHLDEKLGLAADIQRIHAAPSGAKQIAELVALQARSNPSIWAVARAFEAVRRTDPAAERSWQDRLEHRLLGCKAIISRIQAEGKLRKGVEPHAAADLLWTLTSLRMWEDLVLQRGWPAGRYQEWLTRVLLESLTRQWQDSANFSRRFPQTLTARATQPPRARGRRAARAAVPPPRP